MLCPQPCTNPQWKSSQEATSGQAKNPLALGEGEGKSGVDVDLTTFIFLVTVQ